MRVGWSSPTNDSVQLKIPRVSGFLLPFLQFDFSHSFACLSLQIIFSVWKSRRGSYQSQIPSPFFSQEGRCGTGFFCPTLLAYSLFSVPGDSVRIPISKIVALLAANNPVSSDFVVLSLCSLLIVHKARPSWKICQRNWCRSTVCVQGSK